MKSPKTIEDLIETVVKQIEVDLHCGDKEPVEELLKFCPVDNLIEYLPEEDWGKFKHLRNQDEELRTENALKNLITMCPNDLTLGSEIRRRYGQHN